MQEQRNCTNRPLRQHMAGSTKEGTLCGCRHFGRLTGNIAKVTCGLCLKFIARKHPKRASPKAWRQFVIESLLEERRAHEENHHTGGAR